MNEEDPAAPRREPEKKGVQQYLSLSTLGIEMGVSLAVGILLGWYLDRLFGTGPWLTIIFSLFGIAAGFRSIIRLARKDWEENDSGTR